MVGRDLKAGKIIQVPSFLFRGPSDLAGALAGVETCCLVLEALYLLSGCDIDIMPDGLFVFDPFVQQPGNPDAPAPGFCFYFIFVANQYMLCGFGRRAIVFDFSIVTRSSCQGTGLEQADGPEVFVKAEFFICLHG